MEDTRKQAIKTEPPIKQGSGGMLAAARKQQNKTVEEIATELNLSVTQIKTIELDQTDGLPEPTYVRGYIRSYAKLLGLDSDEVLKNYLNPNWQRSSNLNDIPRGIGSAPDSENRIFTPAKVLVAGVLLGSLGFFWYFGMLPALFESRSGSTVPSSENGAHEFVQEGRTEPVSADANIADADIADADIVTGIALDAAQVVPANELQLNFTETSWVDIRDDQNNRLAYKSYAKGDELKVASHSNMSIFIGNAAGVSVEYNGQPFNIKAYREGVYAKFVVGEDE